MKKVREEIDGAGVDRYGCIGSVMFGMGMHTLVAVSQVQCANDGVKDDSLFEADVLTLRIETDEGLDDTKQRGVDNGNHV